ncbi:hypothetical protein F3157_05120 [Virgibacillus dakarensis]|uniref:Uncharacterized protein n=1 Tax=Lentibacillus populi TaxID=1827502 RepID=A0A9W5TV87_9BACI|nr:hypothetical protein [Virgibacillus dakarensis]MTW85038.1 hypothetical protein [Virgibacillus dakarensis]GGB34260.1 hypothetical protein GCM10011409_09640 [Lentibacillus populi]
MDGTDGNLEKYYHYLQNHLVFPFRASYKEEAGPLSVSKYDVNCLRLDQEMKYEEFYIPRNL